MITSVRIKQKIPARVNHGWYRNSVRGEVERVPTIYHSGDEPFKWFTWLPPEVVMSRWYDKDLAMYRSS